MVSICKDMKGAVQKVTYAVAQILQTDDAADVSTVHSAIASLYQIDPMGMYNKFYVLICYINLIT